MEERKLCPCCGRHCDLSAPSCERGEEYARTGVIPERKEHSRHGGEEAECGHHEHHENHGDCGKHGHHSECEGHGRRGDCDKHGHHGKCRGQGHHGECDERGHHGVCEGRGRRGECGKHGGRHKDFGSVMDGEGYAALDENSKLLLLLHELRHMSRFGFDGKGGQNRVLHILAKEGGMTQRALTERLGIQPGSASELLGKLEKAGFILRSPSESDRRTTDVALTDAGRTQAEQAVAQREEKLCELFAVLSGEEKAALLSALEKLSRAWQEKDPHAARETKPE